jgi:hypothetical protein
VAVLVLALSCAHGCGARSELDDPRTLGGSDVGGSGGGGGAVGGNGGAGGGVGGAGGELASCEALAWVGEPVAIGVAAVTPAVRPTMISVGGGRVGLAFQMANDPTLLSLAIDGAFDAWPPTLGAFFANHPQPARLALSPGVPGEIAYLTSGFDADLDLGSFEPGQNGSSFVDLPLAGVAMFVARSPAGAFLAGVGTSDAGFLRTAWVSGLPVQPLVTDLGGLGCADAPVVAEVASTDGEMFWLANTSDVPHDDCIDPDLPGPPLFANLWAAEPGTLIPIASRAGAAPLDEIDLAANGQRRFIGMRDVAFSYTLWRSDDLDEVESLDEPQLDAQHDLALMDADLVLARLLPDGAVPGGEVSLHLFSASGRRSALRIEDANPTSEPSLIIEGDRALVAWADAVGSIWIARADCLR